MGIEEDRENFNSTGVRGHLRRLMRECDEGFVRELPGGWRGEIVAERPAPGSGPYLHYRRGEPVLRHCNQSPDDGRIEVYRVEL